MNEPLRILVIDDDAPVLNAAAIILAAMGLEVSTARDGVAGLKLFRKEHHDIVLTDILMPNKDGIETIREIRRSRPDTRIIAMSGGGEWMDKRVVLEFASHLGASAILDKPFDSRRLRQAIEQAIAEFPGTAVPERKAGTSRG